MARPRKNPNKPEWTGMPSSSAALEEIKTAIIQSHPCLSAIEAEKSNLSDIFNELNQKYGIPRRVFNALVKFSYFGNADIQFNKNAEIQEAWDACFSNGTN